MHEVHVKLTVDGDGSLCVVEGVCVSVCISIETILVTRCVSVCSCSYPKQARPPTSTKQTSASAFTHH